MTLPLLDPFEEQEIIEILTKKFEHPIQIQSIIQLSEPERRNKLLRVYLQGFAKDSPFSLIMKQTCLAESEEDQESFERFARDWAGLEFLNQLPLHDRFFPQFYGGSPRYRFILFEDLGDSHVSLVDSLTGRSEDQAQAAVTRFMRTLGQFHAACFGKTHLYCDILEKLTVKVLSWQEEIEKVSETLFPKLQSLFKTFLIPQPESVWEDIHNVLWHSLAPGPFTTFIHGDICPDNVFESPYQDKLYFIDFEWGSVRNALLDGTYLRMSMPTCWCSKAFPNHLIDSLEAQYRDELIMTNPSVNDKELYNTAYVHACGFWVLNSLAQIESVMKKDDLGPSGPVPENSLWKNEENWVRPRLISRLQAFIDVSKKHDQLPTLREGVDHILKEIKLNWPNAKPLAFYPAFIKGA